MLEGVTTIMPPNQPVVSQPLTPAAKPRRTKRIALYIANAIVLGIPLLIILGTIALTYKGESGSEFLVLGALALLSLFALPVGIILLIDLIIFTRYANRRAKETPPVYFPVVLAVIFWIIFGGNMVSLLLMTILG